MSRILRILGELPKVASHMMHSGMPKRSLLFGPVSFGDDLLCTTVLHEARRRGIPFAMMTMRPEIFFGNSDPSQIISINDYFVNFLRLFGRIVVQPYYAQIDVTNPHRDILPNRHILAEMCALANIQGEVDLRPYFHLSDREKELGALAKQQITVQSSCLSAAVPFSTKEWGPAQFGEVIVKLQRDFHFIQVGSAQDSPLPVQTDLRGKTTVRETAAILSASDTFLGLEGFLTHLARAVDCPSVVIIGGRATPATVGYNCNENFYNPVACAPCGLRNGCPFELKCMTSIHPEQVLVALTKLVSRQLPRPLICDTAVLS